MKKIKIVSLIMAVVLLAGIRGCKKDKKAESGDNKQTVTEKNGKNKSASAENKNQEDVKSEMKETEEEKVYTPTFMYFVSNNDADFAKTNETIEKLKGEYNGKVNFDVRNVTEDPSQLENFPVEGQTPALIMLDTSNNISNFLFMNGNYDDLKAAIEAALK